MDQQQAPSSSAPTNDSDSLRFDILPVTPNTPTRGSISVMEESKPQFVAPADHADACVIVVTFQSEHSIVPLISSLRGEAAAHRLRVIVVDNASSDATVRIVRRQADVLLIETGGNIGYAGAINVALAKVGRADAILILNPDLIVQPGAISAMLCRMRVSHAGAVVPRILNSSGAVYPSLRREPSVPRALGDAVMGGKVSRRPSFLGEGVLNKAAYECPKRVDWATGAAILIDRAVASCVGAWDEQFFLYSEETDYCRRMRDAGNTIWFEPSAVVTHSQGGSGRSIDLDRLLAVNRVRYARKHSTRAVALAFRVAVILHEAMRAYAPAHRAVLKTLMSEETWAALPHARLDAASEALSKACGSIVIPAHNESAVIGRTLESLEPLLRVSNVEIIVAANGCSDNTAEIARSVLGVKVLELPEPSKIGALNAADEQASQWPRMYLDADIEISPAAVLETLSRLNTSGAIAGRPPFRWDLLGSSWPVLAYYRARSRIASSHRALWGAGVYGMSESGRGRFGHFPDVIGDDVFVDRLFAPERKLIVETEPVTVRVPRSASDLLKVLRRQQRGATEVGAATTRDTLMQLVRTVRGPSTLFDAIVYAAFALHPRLFRRGAGQWERDESTRSIDLESVSR